MILNTEMKMLYDYGQKAKGLGQVGDNKLKTVLLIYHSLDQRSLTFLAPETDTPVRL